MKHLTTVFNALSWLLAPLFAGLPTQASAQVGDMPQGVDSARIEPLTTADPMDSVEFSLLTCQPHDEVYSLYGHTAIRLHDRRGRTLDAAFNYGVFNFHAPLFVVRFVFGLTDYELGAYPFNAFQNEYRHFGSMVIEQVLNLTPQEKQRLYAALIENVRPENKVYRYNYFYNNCTIKARDIIEQCIDGKIEYAPTEGNTPTWRDMVHTMTRNNPWSQWGNDMLLGIQADQPADRRQQEFLPNNLLYDFDHARIYSNGSYRPLVKERRQAVPPGVQQTQASFPLSPVACAVILLVVSIVLAAIQFWTHRVFRFWSALLMVVCGTIGIVLTLMLFSQHPTVRLNLQILFFNPVHWVFLWPVLKGKPTRYWFVVPVLTLLFLIGGLFQHYAEGIYVLALSLLLQSILHINRSKK